MLIDNFVKILHFKGNILAKWFKGIGSRVVNLDYIRFFYHVARERSIVRAAELLGIPRSTLGKHIQAFETECGFNLFTRHKTGLDLTPKGEELFKFAARSIESLEEGLMKIQKCREPDPQTLRIITTTGVTHLWLISKLPAFRELFPFIQICIQTTNDHVDFLASGFDVAVLPKVVDGQEVTQRKVFASHHFLFASQAYLEKNGVPQAMDDLASHQLISFHRLRESHRGPIDWHIDLLGRGTLVPSMSVNSAIGVLYAIKQGLGIGLLPIELPFIKESNLIKVLPEKTASVDVFFMVKKDEHLQGEGPIAGLYKVLSSVNKQS